VTSVTLAANCDVHHSGKSTTAKLRKASEAVIPGRCQRWQAPHRARNLEIPDVQLHIW